MSEPVLVSPVVGLRGRLIVSALFFLQPGTAAAISAAHHTVEVLIGFSSAADNRSGRSPEINPVRSQMPI